jgi:hypothetical protein
MGFYYRHHRHSSLDRDVDQFDKHFEDMENKIDVHFKTTKKAVVAGCIGAAVGGAAGAAFGLWVGDSANDYFVALQQAPQAIRYAVDTIGLGAGGIIGAQVGGSITAAPYTVKMWRNFWS